MSAIREMLLRLSRYSEQLASASEEISAGAQLTSEAASSQSNQAQNAAVAIQEMSATEHEISRNARQAAEASKKAADSARDGGKAVEQTLATMRSIAESSSNVVARMTELGKSSQQIGKIIAVIDSIAGQTNLLALNAAIEAARAGQHGRGFAVVADEVRKLAERTTDATKEISATIRSIQAGTEHAVQAMELGSHDVQLGVERTSASGAALQELIGQSAQVGDMVAQIATAAAEQTTATQQIDASVTQISSSIQQSAAAAIQTAKACSDLSSVALDLRTMVGNFKLNGDREAEEQSATLTESARGSERYRAAGAATHG
jgi:methyl-accepting chemotaxis protein